MKKIVLSIFATILLSGCAGTPFSFDQAREIKVGMTKSGVEQIMGKPYMITTSSEQEIWIYSFATGFGRAKAVSFIFIDGKVKQVPNIPGSFN